MQIIGSQFNVFYPRIKNLRTKLFELEEKLKDQFQIPFNLIPIPDDAPAEIPRIIATSKKEYSQLHISLSDAGLITNYDHNFNYDWNKCKEYIEKKSAGYIPVIEELSQGAFLYSGLVIKIELPIQNDPVQFLKDKFLNLSSKTTPFDINYKLTFVLEDTYYINMTFNNGRNFTGIGEPEHCTPVYLGLKKEYIELLLDINDRYGFNYQKDYISNRLKQKRLFDLATWVLQEKLDGILEKGEFSI